MRRGSSAAALHGSKGGYSLSAEREYPPLHPPRERALIGSFGLERLLCLRNGNACARRCRVRTARRFASTPIIRCCAAVGGSAALRMRHTPCGCRSAHLVEVRSNFRLPPVPSMRRAQQCRYFASSLPPSKRHSRLTTVRRGCWMCRIAGIHGEAMYTALTLRSACSYSSCKLPMPGVEGSSPRPFSWGCKGDILFLRKRISPFALCRVPTRCGARSSAAALHPPCALRAQKETALAGCFPPAPEARKLSKLSIWDTYPHFPSFFFG